VLRFGDPSDPVSLERDGFAGERFDVLVSCLASRTGAPGDARKIDLETNVTAFGLAKEAGVGHVILLSAICVQRPKLAFQFAKLAAEKALMESGLCYSIVRPTAFFKSLTGQLDRLRSGKPYLLLGDGRLTACKPISDTDLACFMADCLDDPSRRNAVLPIGGPGPAITPLEQGQRLFALLEREAKFRRVPVRLLDVIAGTLAGAGRLVPSLADKAEFARIGRYYATESMLVWDAEREAYDADLTPSFGTDTLFDHYAELVAGKVSDERGDHAVF